VPPGGAGGVNNCTVHLVGLLVRGAAVA
jgi:hypothetical protein